MRKLFYLGTALLLLVRCNDESSEPAVKTIENYLPLAVGNYWIYENYQVDTLGNETKLSEIDSVIITKDTVINNEKYFVFEGTHYLYNENWGILYVLRDSSGYIVDNSGSIIFSSDNFIDTLSERVDTMVGLTIYRTSKMERSEISITVPAGTYTVIDDKCTLVIMEDITGIKQTKYIHNYYAKDVGKIMSNVVYVSGPDIIERRLIRYHIEEVEK
jgi:hypothetical protein